MRNVAIVLTFQVITEHTTLGNSEILLCFNNGDRFNRTLKLVKIYKRCLTILSHTRPRHNWSEVEDHSTKIINNIIARLHFWNFSSVVYQMVYTAESKISHTVNSKSKTKAYVTELFLSVRNSLSLDPLRFKASKSGSSILKSILWTTWSYCTGYLTSKHVLKPCMWPIHTS